MKRNKICSCGKMIQVGTKCSCAKKNKNDSQKKHVSRNTKFQKLRKRIINRDGAKCVRCEIKYHVLTIENLQAHHIKSWQDFPELAYDENNIVTVCKSCNLDLGTKNKLDFRWEPPFSINENYLL